MPDNHDIVLPTEDETKITATTYWPPEEVYDPGLTDEDWLGVLIDERVTRPECVQMLEHMMALGGECTCGQLAEQFGQSNSYYYDLGHQFGQQISQYTGAQPYNDRGTLRYYLIPFVARFITENGVQRSFWKVREPLQAALKRLKRGTDVPLNTILYGPPGTGKTYRTVRYAVAVVEDRPLADVEREDYDAVLTRYHSYQKGGRIAFTTFHQSFGYEEFIEGIRPDEEAGDVHYSVQPGVFKRFCERAEQAQTGYADRFGIRPDPAIWKVSLERTGDNATRTECLENGHIRIGWESYGADISDEKEFAYGGQTALNAFMNRMQVGDVVLSCYSASTIDAIGVVTGDYSWDDSYAGYNRVRPVKWILKNIREDIVALNGGASMVQGAVYQMPRMTLGAVFSIIQKYIPDADRVGRARNFVFIIDEINRGNISKIFGELITLIEPTRRLGAGEETRVQLPCSRQSFGVPGNVWLLGTMNTADRSIAVLDTALRRRFAFREMLPDPAVLDGVTVEGIDVRGVLTRLNERISVLYDREHTIGHAYFTPLLTSPTMATLAEIFSDRVLPLLQEYFYEDYEKIRLVLGDNRKEDTPELQFICRQRSDFYALFGTADVELDEACTYTVNRAAFQDPAAYQSI